MMADDLNIVNVNVNVGRKDNEAEEAEGEEGGASRRFDE